MAAGGHAFPADGPDEQVVGGFVPLLDGFLGGWLDGGGSSCCGGGGGGHACLGGQVGEGHGGVRSWRRRRREEGGDKGSLSTMGGESMLRTEERCELALKGSWRKAVVHRSCVVDGKRAAWRKA